MNDKSNDEISTSMTLMEWSLGHSGHEVNVQRAIRTGQLHDPSDDTVVTQLTKEQVAALKLQAQTAGIVTMEPTQARHIAGQAALVRPKLAHLMHLAVDNDERGLDALIALAVHNNRYPKG